jgi:very-short-patch-repair endonuclease
LRALNQEERRTESPFEREVLKRLTIAGYLVHTQWQVGYFRIDMVVEGGGKRLAVECDGDRWHPLEKLAEDIERQTILERLGWQLVRVRGTAFYRNPELAMQPVFARLAELEITQEACTALPQQTTDMTLIHELDDLIAQDCDDEKPSEAIAPAEAPAAFIDDPLALFELNPAAASNFNNGQLEAFLSSKGGLAQVETFLREVAAAAGYHRLGKNIRAGLEAELFKLQREGRASLSGGIIRLL